MSISRPPRHRSLPVAASSPTVRPAHLGHDERLAVRRDRQLVDLGLPSGIASLRSPPAGRTPAASNRSFPVARSNALTWPPRGRGEQGLPVRADRVPGNESLAIDAGPTRRPERRTRSAPCRSPRPRRTRGLCPPPPRARCGPAGALRHAVRLPALGDADQPLAVRR